MAAQPQRNQYRKPAYNKGGAAPAAQDGAQFQQEELTRVTGLFPVTRKDGSVSENVMEIINKEEITIPAGVVLKVLITSPEKRQEGKPIATLCYKVLG